MMVDRYTQLVLTLVAAGLFFVGVVGVCFLLRPGEARAYTMRAEVEQDLNPQPMVICKQTSVSCGDRQDYGEECSQFRVRQETYSGTPECQCYDRYANQWVDQGPALIKWSCK